MKTLKEFKSEKKPLIKQEKLRSSFNSVNTAVSSTMHPIGVTASIFTNPLNFMASVVANSKKTAHSMVAPIKKASDTLLNIFFTPIDEIDDGHQLSELLTEAWAIRDYEKARKIITRCVERGFCIQCVNKETGRHLLYFSTYFGNTDLLLQIIQEAVGEVLTFKKGNFFVENSSEPWIILSLENYYLNEPFHAGIELQSRNPIFNAFYSGDLKAINLFINFNCNLLEKIDHQGEGVLFYALKANSKNKNQRIVLDILQQFWDILLKILVRQNSYGENLFHKVSDSYPEAAVVFFEWIKNLNNIFTSNEKSSLLKLILLLLNHKNNKGQTALEYAKSKKNVYCIQQLSLFIPVEKPIVKEYAEYSSKALLQAYSKNDLVRAQNIIKECFIRNIPLEVVKNEKGLHIFHLAAMINKTQELLDLFTKAWQETFSITKKTWQQIEGEEIAAEKGEKKEKKLINLKAYFLSEGEEKCIGWLPLHIGISCGDVDAIRTSLNYDIPLTSKGPNNTSILHFALQNLRNLIDLWAELKPEQRKAFTADDLILLLEPNCQGNTPFHYVCLINDETRDSFFAWIKKVQKKFPIKDQDKLKQKIKENLQILNEEGFTATQYALLEEDDVLIKILFELGGEIPEAFLIQENINFILNWIKLGAPLTPQLIQFAIQIQNPEILKEIFVIRHHPLNYNDPYFCVLKHLIFPQPSISIPLQDNLKSMDDEIEASVSQNKNEKFKTKRTEEYFFEDEIFLKESQQKNSEELKKALNLFDILKEDQNLSLKDLDDLVSHLALSQPQWSSIAKNFHSLQESMAQTLSDPKMKFANQKLPDFFRNLFSTLYFYEKTTNEKQADYQSKLQTQIAQLCSELQVQVKFGNTKVSSSLALFLSSLVGTAFGLGVGGVLALVTLSILSSGFAAPIVLPLLIGVLTSSFTAGIFVGTTTAVTYTFSHNNLFKQSLLQKEAHTFQKEIETSLTSLSNKP